MAEVRCDLCESDALEAVYPVPGTRRELVVNVCRNCGLVQSLPRIDHVPRRSAFPDSGASFGNIRYGKGFRTEFALNLLGEHKTLDSFKHCLDVGANRGSFILALLDRAPDISVTAVEPDPRVVGDYEAMTGVTFINERIENTELPENTYDLVYHCHTLEHQAAPLESLRAIRGSMTDDGIMFLEVPNIALLHNQDLVEEWFIDKHLYHFSISTLLDLVQKAGFAIVQTANSEDKTNITLLLKKNSSDIQPAIASNEYESNVSLVSSYAESLQVNQNKLVEGARKLAQFTENKKVAIWGAGRIYTSIVDIGKFDPTQLCCVVDKHLCQYVPEMFGVAVSKPEVIQEKKPDVVLVASRLYLDEIKDELSSLYAGASVLTLDDVLEGNLAA